MSEHASPADNANPAYAPGAWTLPGERVRLAENQPLRLDSGVELKGVDIAYQTWGTLNADKSNAVWKSVV